MLRLMESGEAGLAYMAGRLANGNSLSALLLSEESRLGGASALVPAGTPSDRVTRFSEGGVLPQSRRSHDIVRTPNTDAWLARALGATMDESGVICIVENAMALCHHPITARLPNVVCLGAEVYHLIRPGTDTGADVLVTLRAASSIPTFVGILTRVPVAAKDWRPTSMADLAGLARNVVLLFVGAYDGESYLIRRSADLVLHPDAHG